MLDEPIPASVLAAFAFCPRQAWLSWIEGEQHETFEILDGRRVHQRVDAHHDPLPAPDALPDDATHEARGSTLAGAGLIARFDLIELADGRARPVEYKRGQPPEDGVISAPTRIQLGAQALVLQANGHTCTEAAVWYDEAKRRIGLTVDAALLDEVATHLQALTTAVERGERPPPLIQSPKCLGCSLAAICQPDEIGYLNEAVEAAEDLRPLVVEHEDAHPLHVGLQGAVIGLKGQELEIRLDRQVKTTAALGETSSVSVYGNVMFTTQALRQLLINDVTVAFHSQSGWFYGIAHPMSERGLATRRAQFAAAADPTWRLAVAHRVVEGKIRNQRTFLRRNHPDLPAQVLERMERLTGLTSPDVATLRGREGEAAALYFAHFNALIRPPGGDRLGQDDFHFDKRRRRPAPDPVNAVLNFTYALLVKEWTAVLLKVGFDPMLGLFHEPRAKRPALALDLMEEFRPIVADSVVVTAINTGRLQAQHFVRGHEACALTAQGRNALLEVFEHRMDTEITHPIFGYRATWRRTFEIQARLFARWIQGEILTWPHFKVR